MQRAVTRIAVIASAALLIGASAPSLAHAQPRAAALLPPGGDAAQSPKVKAEILRAATHVLTTLGYQVHAPEIVTRALRQNGFGDCTEATCAPAVFSSIDAELVVLTRVWNKSGQPHEVAVHITRMKPSVPKPRTGRGVVALDGTTLLEAVTAATAEALRDTEKENARVLVRGTPEGATVVIDGEPKGTLPLILQLPSGSHSMIVSAEGHVDDQRTFEVPPAPAPTMHIDVDLVQGTGSPPKTAAYATTPTIDVAARPEPLDDRSLGPNWNTIAGASFAAVGAGLVAWGVVGLVQDGKCSDTFAATRECDRTDSKPMSIYLLGGGATSLILGAVFFVFQPLPVAVAPTPGGATLSVRARF